jgi:hypothetical protein
LRFRDGSEYSVFRQHQCASIDCLKFHVLEIPNAEDVAMLAVGQHQGDHRPGQGDEISLDDSLESIKVPINRSMLLHVSFLSKGAIIVPAQFRLVAIFKSYSQDSFSVYSCQTEPTDEIDKSFSAARSAILEEHG